MAKYMVLGRFSDQGVRSVKDTVKRADAAKELGKKMGVDMVDIVWTLGRYDFIATCEAADDETATTFALAVGSGGNVHTETLRAFDRSEMTKILSKMG